MTRTELEEKYISNGCDDFRLRNVDDLKKIHGISISEISGYNELSDEHRELFDKTVVRFYNAHRLDSRMKLSPKYVNFVREVEYAIKTSENKYRVVGCEVYSISGTKPRRIHRYIYEKEIDLKKCDKKFVSEYLRFELKKEWYHITQNEQWY